MNAIGWRRFITRLSSLVRGQRRPLRHLPLRRRTRRFEVELLETRVLLSMAHPTYIVFHGGPGPAQSPAPVGFTPPQIRHAYAVDQVNFGSVVGDGTGQTIAIVDAYDNTSFVSSTDPNFNNSDLHQFDLQFGLPDPPSFTKLAQDGSTNYPPTDPNRGWEGEEALDVEWAHSIAPMASLILVEANDNSIPNLEQAAVPLAASLPGVSAVSMSFGVDGDLGEPTLDSLFTTPAGHQNVTFLASTGDAGSPGGYPAYSPNVVAVGGTSLTLDASNNWVSEDGWSGSGGGQSDVYTEPLYQQNAQNSGFRQIPDVSIIADPNTGVAVYDSFTNGSSTPWEQVGGTSLACPVWAGLIAIANQGRSLVGLGSLDGPNETLPMLYKLPAGDFHDITTGNNGLAAGPGYDMVTGIGTPIANLLIPDLVGCPSVTGDVVYNTATPGPTNVTLVRQSNTIFVENNGLRVECAPVGALKSLTVIGATNASDTLTLDYSGGTFDVPITFDGGGGTGNNRLVLENGKFTNEVSTPSNINSTDGTITLDNQPTIIYRNLTSITDTSAVTNLTVNATSSFDEVNIVDGSSSNGTTTQVNSGNSNTFTPFSFAGKTNLTVNGLAGDDTITLNNPKAGNVLKSLLVDTGAGADQVSVQATTVPTTVTSTALGAPGEQDIVTVSDANNTMQGIQGALTISNPVGLTDLTLDDSGDATGRTATLDATSVTGLAPATITYTAGALNMLQVMGGSGGNTFTIKGTPTNSTGIVSTTLLTGTGNDTVNVQATSANSSLFIDGQDGSDTVTIGQAGSLQNILGLVNVTNALNFSNLTIDDSADTTVRNATLSTSAVDNLGPAEISFNVNSLASLTILGGVANNTYTVLGTSPVPTTTLGAGTGTDVINVGNAANTLADIQGALTIHGQVGSNDVLNVNDQGTTTAQTYTLTDTSVTASSAAAISYDGIDNLTLNAGRGGNHITVTNTAAGGTTTVNGGDGGNTIAVQGTNSATTINAGNGNDTIGIGSSKNQLGSIQGALTIHGQGGAGDSLTLNDQGTTTAGVSYTVTPTTFTASTLLVPFTFDGVEGLTLSGGSGGNSIKVQGTAATTPVTINAGAGNDAILVGDPSNTLGGLQGGLTLHGQAGTNNTLTLNDQGQTNAATYTLTSNSVMSTSAAVPVNFDAIGTLTLNAGSGGNTVNVLSTAASTQVTVFTGAGNDTTTVAGTSQMLSNIQGPLTIHAQGGTSNSLTLDDQQNAAPTSYTLNPTNLVSGATSTPIAFDSLANLTLNAGSGGNHVTLTSTSPGTTTTVNAGNGGNTIAVQGTSSTTTINAGNGGNTIAVQGTGSTTTINAGNGNDTISVGSSKNQLSALQGPLNIHGVGGTDNLAVNDQGTTVPVTYTVKSGEVAASSAGVPIDYDVIAAVTLNGGSGGNTFNVQSTASGTPVTINGGNGSDSFNLGGSSSSLTTLASGVTLHGQGGSNALGLHDEGSSAPTNYVLTANQVSASSAGGPIAFDSMATLGMNTGNGSNFINVQSTSTTTTSIHSGPGNDAFVLSSATNGIGSLAAIHGTINFDAGAGTNSLTVGDSASGIADNFQLSSNQISDSSPAFVLNFASTGGSFGGGVNLSTGNGNSAVNIQNVLPGIPTNVTTGSGADQVTVGVNPASAYVSLSIDEGAGNDTLNVNDAVGNSIIRTIIPVPGVGNGTVEVCYPSNLIIPIHFANVQVVSTDPNVNQSSAQFLFEQITGQRASRAEVNAAAGMLSTPQGARLLVKTLESTPAAKVRLVTSWFVQYFGRPPSGGELARYTRALQRHSEEEVLSAIFNSPDYFRLSGGTTTGFVLRIYQQLLKRAPTGGELAFALQSLTSPGGRGGIAFLVLTSAEYRHDVIQNFIATILMQAPTADLLAQFGGRRKNLRSIRIDFESNPVFFLNGC